MPNKTKSPPLAKVVALRPAAAKSRPGAKRAPSRSVRPVPPLEAELAERALAEMARTLSAAADPTGALRQQLQVISALLKPKAVYVARHSPAHGQLHVEHVRGRYDERITAVAPAEGVVGRAFADGRVHRDHETTAVPLLGPEGPVGCLAVLGVRRVASDTLLLALGAQLSAAYELARLRDEKARREKDLQTAIAGLKSLEANREELLGNVSHDLKNPLTAIKASLAMLLREKQGPLTEGQRRAALTSERNADRLLRMVNDLVLMSRLQTGKMQLHQRPFGLKSLAEEVVRALQPLADATRVSLQVPASAEVFVRGDKERLAEAVTNLVEHAIGQSEPDARVGIRVSLQEGLATLEVEDAGAGLSEEEQEHLFDPFHRSLPGTFRRVGIGLSLPLAAKIVSLHGGRVESRSRLGEGTTLLLRLPMFAGAVAAPEGTAASAAPRAGGILLVEDDADCREVLQQVLEEEGYRVMSTGSAANARALLENIRPAMVLLDLRLSDGDGRNVLRYIRGTPLLKDVAVYIISGASDLASLTAGTGLDRIDGYFEKPLDLPKLLGTVSVVVRPSLRAM